MCRVLATIFFCFSVSSLKIEIKIYNTIILLVLYGCETWSLTLGEEHNIVGCENRVLIMFGHKSKEVAKSWRYRVIKLRRTGWMGHVSCGKYEMHVEGLRWGVS
jgi:hypothetical protein